MVDLCLAAWATNRLARAAERRTTTPRALPSSMGAYTLLGDDDFEWFIHLRYTRC